MKAIHVEIGFDECKKVEAFLQGITDENIFTYSVDNIQFVIVTIAWALCQLEAAFEEPAITVLR